MSSLFFRFSRWSLIAAVLILLAAVLLQVLPKPVAYHYELKSPLAQWLPGALPGWRFEDVTIASTPEVAKAVDELLNFSDGIYRVYRSDSGREIKVYIAYWEPGKMDPRLVGVHSPDVCWVGAGWVQVGDRSRRTLSAPNGMELRSGHDRTFEMRGQREEVVFWHLIGGKPSRYLEPDQGFWTIREILRNPLAPRYEQFFVRISAPNSLDSVADEPMMQRIIEAVGAVQAPPSP